MITDYMLTNKHAHALNGNFGPAIPAWLLWGAFTALVSAAFGIWVGDKDWPWEHQHEGDDDDNTWFDPIVEPIKKGFAGLLILGAVIVAATLYKGGK